MDDGSIICHFHESRIVLEKVDKLTFPLVMLVKIGKESAGIGTVV